MKRIISFLCIAFVLTFILNITNVLAAASLVSIDADVPYVLSSYGSSTRYKEVQERQLLDVVDTNKTLQAAIFTSDGAIVSPSWVSFNGEIKVWFDHSAEQSTSAQLGGKNIRVRIRSASLLGGHIWAIWLPDPSGYGY